MWRPDGVRSPLPGTLVTAGSWPGSLTGSYRGTDNVVLVCQTSDDTSRRNPMSVRSDSQVSQTYAEVLSNDGEIVWRMIIRMTSGLRRVIELPHQLFKLGNLIP